MKKEFIIVFLILCLGFGLRICNLHERTTFNADQEWLAFRAKDLINGDLPLLGPVTSIGSFSIGPGFIYLWSFAGIFTENSPITGAYLSVFLGMATLISIYLFSKHFIDQKVAYLILFLGAISSNLIFWDQIPWAPSLFYLSQIMLLVGAYLSSKRQIGYILMAFGFVAGFQSHFGIVLSLVSVIFYLLLIRPVSPFRKTLIASIIIVSVGLLPNILFDLTHDFANFKKLGSVLKGDGISYFVSLSKVTSVLNFNTTSLVYPKNDNLLDSVSTKTLFALILVNAISYLRDKKFKNLSLLLLITGILPAVFFYIQQGKFSEYYLMMTVPSLIFIFVLFLRRIMDRKILIVLTIIISLFLNYKRLSNRYVPWNLKAKEEIAKSMIEKAGKNGYGISLTTSLGNNFGFRYIFDYYKIIADIPTKKGETRVFSIIIPEGFDGMVGMKDYSGIGLRWDGI